MNIFESFIPFNRLDMYNPNLMLDKMSKYYNYNNKVYSKFDQVNETIVKFIRSKINNYAYSMLTALEEKRKRRDRDYSTENIFWWNNYSAFLNTKKDKDLLTTLDNYFRNQWVAGNILATSRYREFAFPYINRLMNTNENSLFSYILRNMVKSFIILYDYKYIFNNIDKLNEPESYPIYREKNIKSKMEKILFFDVSERVYPNYNEIFKKYYNTIREREMDSTEIHKLLRDILVKYDLKLTYSIDTIQPRDLEGFTTHTMVSLVPNSKEDIFNVEYLLGLYIIKKLKHFNDIMYKKYGFDVETMFYMITNVLRTIDRWIENNRYYIRNRTLKDAILNSMPDYIQYTESTISYNRGIDNAKYNSCSNITAMPEILSNDMVSSSAYLDSTILNLSIACMEYVSDTVIFKFNIDNLFKKAEERGIFDDFEYSFNEY